VTTHPYLVLRLGMSGAKTMLPPTWRAQGQVYFFSFVVGYKKGLVETRRQGIPTVLQSKFDIAPLFMHRNLWRYIEGGDKLKCSKMNFFSQTLIGATLRCDCIGPNRTNSLHTT